MAGIGTAMHIHGPAVFVGDSIGLDFLNSITTSTSSTTDWIDSGEGLLSWLEQAQLVPAEALAAIRAQALPGELDKVAAQVRELREWFRGFVQSYKGSPLPAESLDELGPLNRLLAGDQAFSRIVLGDTGGPAALEFQSLRRWQSPEALFLPIAEALARFVCAEDFSNVKACEGQACTLLFADRTRTDRKSTRLNSSHSQISY